ncbi:uncharacterized protein HKW66_Vig0012330 [Vigna angularis]|uniref:Histidine-containing phosphotransfer protein n=1 Tax=Phaseolus angularis TaxID=3914 RepID=A0A8T0LHY1_PHAAN|nr:uncharacterized protein HKW66_Vig0012330 [Vigna angularis]
MKSLKLQLSETLKSMKQQGLVDDQFSLVYSMKTSIEDHFFIEIISEFCTCAREDFKLLTQIMNEEVWNYDLMKEYVYKVKGSSSSFGACTMAAALTAFERAIDSASKEDCLKALKQAQREFNALQEKLHACLQLERRVVLSAIEGATL